MKIKHRLALIVFLPIVLLLGFVAKNFLQLWDDRSYALQSTANMETAKVVGELIHALQVERGLSGGYLVSLGDEFGSDLAAARAKTSEAFADYVEKNEAVTAVAPNEVLQVTQGFDDLDAIRTQVTDLQIGRAEAGAFYTDKINALIQLSATLIGSSISGEKGELANAYLTIKRAKESAGLERAAGAQGLGIGSMSTRDLEKFVAFESFQIAFLTAARGPLSGEQRAHIDNMIDERRASKVSQMRQSISRLAQSGTAGGLTAKDWWDATTARIDEMHELELAIGADLVATAKENAAQATTGLLIITALSLLVASVSGLFAYVQSKRIVRPLARFVDSLQKIAGEDYDFELQDQDRSDEIGDFARALSEVQESLKAAAGTQLENRFKGTAFASASTPMFVVDQNFVVTYMNEASTQLFHSEADLIRSADPGFDPSNVLGARLDVFFNKLEGSAAKLNDDSALPINLDLSFGESRVGVQIAGIFDDDRNHIGNVISWDDVTRERTNEGKLNAINRSQAVIEFTIDGTITAANDNFLQTMGYASHEIIGKHHSTFIPQDSKSLAENRDFWRSLANGENQRGEYKRLGKGGKEVWIFATYSPIFDENGVPFKVVKFASDITSEKAKRAEVSSQLEAIHKSQAVIEFDLEGKVVDANENFLETMGYSFQEIEGKHHRIFMPEDARDGPEYQSFWQTLREGTSISDRFEYIGSGGRRVWLRASYNPILDEDGKPTRVMKIANDITESVNQQLDADAAQKKQSDELAVVISALSIGLTDLSNGDLTTRISADFADQYEQLKADFNRAIEQLNSLILSVASGTGGISSNAREITQAADDLSQRTESQAATLEETAAALEQLTASVKSASEGAKRANEVVANAKNNAEASGKVVQQAVSAMDEIEKSSSQISQIIGVIDDIAFQTNLLALNAGVEAARAGEAGRGFAVVASEVRALAQRSSDAAKEIKGLISASSQHVESGVELVDRAGDALKQILSSVADINELVAEIASSSNEQSIGISEINTAVSQMDQSTQQNAAMVEQTTAACHAMSQETAEVVELVSRFKTGGEADADEAWLHAEASSIAKAKSSNQVAFKSRKGSAKGNVIASTEAVVDDAGWQDF